jgi:hypothetical protein
LCRTTRPEPAVVCWPGLSPVATSRTTPRQIHNVPEGAVVRTSRSPPGRRILNPRAPTTPVGRVGVAFDWSAVVMVAGAVGETPTFQSEISVTRGVSESGRTKSGPRSAVAPTNGDESGDIHPDSACFGEGAPNRFDFLVGRPRMPSMVRTIGSGIRLG